MLVIVTGGVECIGCVIGREVKKWLGHILQKQTGASWAIFIDHISSEGKCAVLMQCTSACDTCTLQSTAIIYHCKHEFISSPVSDPYAKKLWLFVIFSLSALAVNKNLVLEMLQNLNIRHEKESINKWEEKLERMNWGMWSSCMLPSRAKTNHQETYFLPRKVNLALFLSIVWDFMGFLLLVSVWPFIIFFTFFLAVVIWKHSKKKW